MRVVSRTVGDGRMVRAMSAHRNGRLERRKSEISRDG